MKKCLIIIASLFAVSIVLFLLLIASWFASPYIAPGLFLAQQSYESVD